MCNIFLLLDTIFRIYLLIDNFFKFLLTTNIV